MTARKTRRAVLAELLLLADPVSVHVRRDGVSLSVDFDSVAELRSWLRLAGLDGPDLLTSGCDGTDDDGRPRRMLHAFPTWHGWKVYAYAVEYADTMPQLDPATADRLAAVAVAG